METGEVLLTLGRNSWRKVGSITKHRKGAEGKRMAEWLVAVMKSGDADGAKGPC